MTSQASRRIAALEALPAPHGALNPQEAHARSVATAARCGFTEEQVMSQFGGWPGFAYAKIVRGTVVDPSEAKPELDARFVGRDPMVIYFDLMRG